MARLTHYNIDTCRLYFNSRADSRKLWSIDFGQGTEELHFGAVWLVNVAGRTGTDLAADNVRKPAAWIAFSHVAVDVDEEKASAVIRQL